MQAISGETYDFSAKPKVVKPRTKYREQEEEEDDGKLAYANMMFDRRVVRGNTYAPIVTSKNTDLKDATKFSRPIKRPPPMQKQNEEQKMDYEPGTPPPVQGRQNVDVQTDEFVEALTDKPPEYEKDTQTDFYIDRPVVRLFMPKKHGIDKESQIWDGDLFSFDYEVEPILQVLIGKTLEQSRMEVLEEEELRVMKEEQKKYEQLRNAELAEVQRFEAKERRLLEESERRKLQYDKKKQQNIFSHKKLISRVIAKNYLSKLKPRVFDILEDHGVFRDPLQMSLCDKLLPWLYDEVHNELVQKKEVEKQFNEFISNLIVENQGLHKSNYEKEMERRAVLKEEERQRQIAAAERKAKKEAEKRRKIEMERRAKLIEDIKASMISKGEPAQLAPLTQTLSDIDGYGQQTPFLGLFGNIIGEVVLFLKCLQNMSHEEQFAYLKDIKYDSESTIALYKLMQAQLLAEATIDVPISAATLEQITAETNGAITIENIKTPDEENAPKVQELLINGFLENLPVVLNAIQQSADQTGIDVELFNGLVDNFIRTLYTEEGLLPKVKFVVVPAEKKEIAGLCRMSPNVKELTFNPNSDKFGVEPEEDQEPQLPTNLAESDFKSEATLFAPVGGDINVWIVYHVLETILRRDTVTELAKLYPTIASHEYAILLEATNRMPAIQQIVMDYIKADYPILDMSTY